MSKRLIPGNGREMETAVAHYNPHAPASVQDSGRFTKTTISVQLVGEEEIPVTYDALMQMLTQQHPESVKVRIVQAETRVRRVEFGPRYI